MMRTMMRDQSSSAHDDHPVDTVRTGEPALPPLVLAAPGPSRDLRRGARPVGRVEHLVDQARTEWWLLTPIIHTFGAQVAPTVELRDRHPSAPRRHHRCDVTQPRE